jgi:leucyl/phenylalanyl-tRNA--protein transferase
MAYLLDESLTFPPADLADDSGVLAVGGDLSPERLLLAYSLGIFPWYSHELPILWHSPDPRTVLEPARIHVPKSLKKQMSREPYRVTLDTAFADVIRACAESPRPGQNGTWITEDMQAAYIELHRRGFAHSIEAWAGGELAGGLYGVSLGAAFFGESMFARRSDASKIAFVTLVRQLSAWRFHMIDCQMETDHLRRFGAENWPRKRYLAELKHCLSVPTRQGRWHFD